MNEFVDKQSRRVMSIVDKTADRARQVPGVRVLEETVRAYGQDRASLLAAALAYYTLLSLFPLMLFILAVTSPFLQSEAAIRAVAIFMSSYLPGSEQLVRSNLEQVTRLRGPLTIFAGAGFLWSASGMFNLIQLGLNRAFNVQRGRPVWRERLVSLVMVIGVSLLFGLSFLLTSILRLAIHYRIIARHEAELDWISPLVVLLLSTLIFALLYRYIPYGLDIRWRNVWLSALLAAILWEIAKWGFQWYLTNIALLNMVYGSVGTIIAVMLWGYITTSILLTGAELAAVLSGARHHERTGKEWWAAVEPTETSDAATGENSARTD